MDDVRILLKREESYAVHALLNIAENPGTNAARIAQELQMPPAFMAKVLRRLVGAGLIESRMGRAGGVALRAELSSLTLLSVVEAVSGRLVLDTCQLKPRCATQERRGACGLKLAWFGATQAIREVLAGVSLEGLVAPPARAASQLQPDPTASA